MTVTAADIRARLIEKYAFKDGWITMAEVTPPKCSRRFDLIAIMGWQSRGHEAMGFEIKVARSDWLRELAEPAKAEPLVSLCSRWWIAAPPGVVEVAELPPSWGLLVIHPEQIRTGKQAPQLDPSPWSDAVWRCMLLRCATRERHAPDELAQARGEGWKEGHKVGLESAQRDASHAERRATELQQIITEAEQATGVPFNWLRNMPALGEAYRLCQSDGRSWQAERLASQAKELRETAERMEQAAEALREPVKTEPLSASPSPSTPAATIAAT